MRNFYASLEIEIIQFQTEDVIRTSEENAENDFSDPFNKGWGAQ